jgi:predicted nucleotidyltransferase
MMSRDVETLIRMLGMVAGETQRRYRAEILGIFGSYVRGEQRETSDLDVLVRFAPGATLFHLVGLADFLEEMLGIRVDVVPVDALREEIRDRILQEAVYL